MKKFKYLKNKPCAFIGFESLMNSFEQTLENAGYNNCDPKANDPTGIVYVVPYSKHYFYLGNYYGCSKLMCLHTQWKEAYKYITEEDEITISTP